MFLLSQSCYCVNVVSVTSAPRYITSAALSMISSMYIRGLTLRNFAELAEAVPIELIPALQAMFCSIVLVQCITTSVSGRTVLTLIAREMLQSTCFSSLVSEIYTKRGSS